MNSFPPTLFEENEIFRKADKPQLAHAVDEFSNKKSDKIIMESISPTEHYVLDGVSFLFTAYTGKGRQLWFNSAVLRQLCHYDKATVVCDGYDKVHQSKTTLINNVDKIYTSLPLQQSDHMGTNIYIVQGIKR